MNVTEDRRRQLLGPFNVSEAAHRVGQPIQNLHREIRPGNLAHLGPTKILKRSINETCRWIIRISRLLHPAGKNCPKVGHRQATSGSNLARVLVPLVRSSSVSTNLQECRNTHSNRSRGMGALSDGLRHRAFADLVRREAKVSIIWFLGAPTYRPSFGRKAAIPNNF